MLSLATAFRCFFPMLLATLALTFGVNALISSQTIDVPDDSLPTVEFRIEEPTVVDAAVTAAVEAALDNPNFEDDVFDRAEQCCLPHGRRVWRGPRWHMMIP